MELTIRTLVIIIVIIISIVALFGVATSVIGSAGENARSSGQDSLAVLGCVMNNFQKGYEYCRDASTEYEPPVVHSV